MKIPFLKIDWEKIWNQIIRTRIYFYLRKRQLSVRIAQLEKEKERLEELKRLNDEKKQLEKEINGLKNDTT